MSPWRISPRGLRRGDRRLHPRRGKVARALGLEESGYRILANHGPDSHQEVLSHYTGSA